MQFEPHELLTEADLAAQLGVAAKSLPAMAEQGTCPPPLGQRQGHFIWSASSVRAWYASLHDEQAAYAPVSSEQGKKDRDKGFYICPTFSSGHIGLRRPRKLVLIESAQDKTRQGGVWADIYTVEALQTSRGVWSEAYVIPDGEDPRHTPYVEFSKVRPDANYEWTLFHINLNSVQRIQVERSPQRGGTVSTASIMDAMESDPDREQVWRISNGKVS